MCVAMQVSRHPSVRGAVQQAAAGGLMIPCEPVHFIRTFCGPKSCFGVPQVQQHCAYQVRCSEHPLVGSTTQLGMPASSARREGYERLGLF